MVDSEVKFKNFGQFPDLAIRHTDKDKNISKADLGQTDLTFLVFLNDFGDNSVFTTVTHIRMLCNGCACLIIFAITALKIVFK